MVPQSWIIDCLKIYKTSNKVIEFIIEAIKNWKEELITGGKTFAEVKTERSIFQRDAPSTAKHNSTSGRT